MTEETRATVSFEEFSKAQQDLQRVTERAQRFEAEIVDLKKTHEKFKDIDLEKYKATMEDYDNLRREQAKGDPVKIEQIVKEREGKVRSEVQKQLDELAKENQSLKTDLKELRIVDRVHSNVAGFFNDDVQEDVKARIRTAVDMRDDGTYIIKDEKGEPRYSAADHTKLMSVDEFAAELQKKKPSWAKPSQVSGGLHAGVKTNGDLKFDPAAYLQLSDSQRGKYNAKERGEMAQAVLSKIPAMAVLAPQGRK